MRRSFVAVLAVATATAAAVAVSAAFAATGDQKRAWSQALRAGDPVAIERVVHSLAVDKNTNRLKRILDGHVARIPDLASSTVEARQAEVYRSLLSVGRYFTDPDSLELIGDFIYSRLGTPGADALLAVVGSGNRSPYVIRALQRLATSAKPKQAKRFSTDQYRNLRLFAIEKIGTVRTWEAVAVLVEVLETEEQGDVKELNHIQRRTGALLMKLTGHKAGASAVNWAGYLAKRQARKFPSPADNDDDNGVTGTAIDAYEKEELFAGETPAEGFVVVVGARWSKPNTKLLRKAGQADEDEVIEKVLDNDRKYGGGLIERLLDTMEISYTKVEREDLDTYDLAKTGVLIFKCAQFNRHCICRSCAAAGKAGLRLYHDKCSLDPPVHIRWQPTMSETATKRVKEFVRAGGYVYGEDWTVREIFERLWPKFVTAVKQKGKPSQTTGKSQRPDLTLKEQTIDVSVAAPSHPYIYKMLDRKMEPIEAEIAPARGEGRTYVARPPEPPDAPGQNAGNDGFEWPVDDESFAAHIINEGAVTTLLVSNAVKKACAKGVGSKGQGAVALTFAPYGQQPLKTARNPARRKRPLRGGAVLWSLGHLASGASGSEDTYSIEFLLLNFINERWARGGSW